MSSVQAVACVVQLDEEALHSWRKETLTIENRREGCIEIVDADTIRVCVEHGERVSVRKKHVAMVRERVCQSTRTINSPHWVGADVNANTDIANIRHSNVANTGHDIANTGYSDASSTDALSGETTRSDKRAQQGQQEDEHRTHYSVQGQYM